MCRRGGRACGRRVCECERAHPSLAKALEALARWTDAPETHKYQAAHPLPVREGWQPWSNRQYAAWSAVLLLREGWHRERENTSACVTKTAIAHIASSRRATCTKPVHRQAASRKSGSAARMYVPQTSHESCAAFTMKLAMAFCGTEGVRGAQPLAVSGVHRRRTVKSTAGTATAEHGKPPDLSKCQHICF